MPNQKLTIVPVTLQPENEKTSFITSQALALSPACMIKTATAEISFFNGVNEHIIQMVMRELKNL